MKNKYTVDYFIKKFSSIPERTWSAGLGDGHNYTCAIGFCGQDSSMPRTDEAIALNVLMHDAFEIGTFADGQTVWAINDASGPEYDNGSYPDLCELGETPKERILTALELIKAGVRV